MRSADSIPVVFITSSGHSGSTLTDLLISSHGDAVSVGEIKRLGREADPPCSCPAPTVWECPFWTDVAHVFQSISGVPLRAIRLHSLDDREFIAHNRALFDAVRRVSGKRVIVDSSKDLFRLRRLIETRVFDLVPIHLVRNPRGVVFSNVRKDRRWLQTAYRHGRRVKAANRILANTDHILLRYEELAADPEAVLARLMQRIGLGFELQQLQWAGRVRHNCGGNRMRYTTDSTIRPDLSWRSGLNGWQKIAVPFVAMAARLAPGPLADPGGDPERPAGPAPTGIGSAATA